MTELVNELVNESRWVAPSVLLAILAAVWVVRRGGVEKASVTAALMAYSGVLVGTMAFGHLLAITLVAVRGELRGHPALLYAIGIVLIIPAVFVAREGLRPLTEVAGATGRAVNWNVALVVALLLTGPLNAPLAVPSLLAIGYARHRRPIVGRGLLAVAVVLAMLMLAGSIRFFMSGGSFEDFSGMAELQ